MQLKKITRLLLITALVFIGKSSFAQYSTYQEIGGSVGPVLINGDWGKSSNAEALLSPTGIEANFIYNVQFVRSRINISNNLGFIYTTHSNHGAPNGTWGFDDAATKKQFEAMTASTSIITLGSMARLDFRDFGLYYPRSTWTPYVGFGFNMMYYLAPNFETTSDAGYPEYLDKPKGDGSFDGMVDEGGFAFSLKTSLGAKFKINRFYYIYGEFTIQRAFSDNLDGLNPDENIVQNDHPDYINGFNLGLIYILW